MSKKDEPNKKDIKKLMRQAMNKINQARTLLEVLPCDATGEEPDIDTTIVGINMGKEYDQTQGNLPIVQYGIQHVRVFLLLEEMYKGKFPIMYAPDYDPNDLDNWNYSMMGYRHRFKQMKEQGFDIRVSLESIFEKEPDGKITRVRKFPNKSFSRKEWGGSEAAITENATKLAIAIHHMYGEFITRLEFTNEAWGEPGIEATKWIIRGMINGFKEVGSNIKLSLGGYQAYEPNNRWSCKDCGYDTGDYIGHIFEPWMANYVDEVTVHPYSFKDGTLQLTEPPDSPQSELRHLYDMIQWRDANYPDLKISITEVGWNSGQIGEALQAEYLNRVLEIAAEQQIYAVYIYETVENPSDGVFTTCGLFYGVAGSRKIGKPKKFLLDRANSVAIQVKQKLSTV